MNWDYIAGFFDGEGSLHMAMGHKKLKRPTAAIGQKDPLPLIAIKEFLEQQGIECYLYQNKVGNKLSANRLYRLQLKTLNDVRKFLYHIAPRLVLKKQLAEDCWRWARVYPALTREQVKKNCSVGMKEYLRRRWQAR